MEEENIISEYYCSNCGTQLSLDDSKCPKCSALLEAYETEDSSITITIETFTNEVNAESAKSLLASAGIECHLKGGDSDGTLFSTEPIELVVLEKDAKLARELMQKLDDVSSDKI